jgi:FkbM family methyltransferase
MLLNGTRFERAARMSYTTVLDHMPSIFLSADQVKSRDYDRLTIEIAARTLSVGGNTVDVGAHCGSILKHLIRHSPAGQHWAFEPIPNLAAQLRAKFSSAHVSQVALSDYTGSADFHFIPTASAHSSLLTRPDIEAGRAVSHLSVDVRRLDDVIPSHVSIAFIKIDVEGGEAGVLRGAANILRTQQPVVVFECHPANLRDCIPPLKDAGLGVSLLADFVAGRTLTPDELVRRSNLDHEYYFVASP